jgi:hypothetical protein
VLNDQLESLIRKIKCLNLFFFFLIQERYITVAIDTTWIHFFPLSKVKYRISTVNHSKKFTDPVPDPDPDSDSGENCLSVCRSDYYIVTCSMRSAVGIKKSYIELFTDSRLFWGGKTRIRNWFFKKNSSTQMSLSGGPTTTLALWIFTKKKGFYTQHSITGHFTPIAPIQPGQLDIPKST